MGEIFETYSPTASLLYTISAQWTLGHRCRRHRVGSLQAAGRRSRVDLWSTLSKAQSLPQIGHARDADALGSGRWKRSTRYVETRCTQDTKVTRLASWIR